MGNQELNLAEPLNKKIFRNYEDQNMRVGICLMQGWRKTMEDTCLAIPNFDGQENSIFGIFDGHGGSIIAQFVACNIENILKNSKDYKNSNYEKALINSYIILDELLKNKDIDIFLKKIKEHQKTSIDINGENGASIINSELLKDNIKSDFLFYCSSDLDHDTNLKYQYPDISPDLLNKKNIEQNNTDKNDNNIIEASNEQINDKAKPLMNLEEKINNKDESEDINKNTVNKFFGKTLNKINEKIYEKDIPDLISNDIGTTANVLLLKKNYFYVANVGDSLSVMYKKKKAYKLNKEHKTTYDKESNRLKKLGTKLQNYRINGKLNITRAIGDLSYKNKNDKYIYEQDVLAIPEVNKYSLDDVDFIIMGSDGFWDYGDDIQTICDNIYNEIKKDPKRDLCKLIGTIFDKGLAKANNYLRGTDNMSCVIIQFMK